MTNLIPSVIPLVTGLDLQSPKVVAKPGTMLSCKNYELVDQMGYKRIDGYVPYGGNITLKDFEGAKYWSRRISTTNGTAFSQTYTNQFISNADGEYIGYCFSVTFDGIGFGTLRFVSFLGNPNINGTLAAASIDFLHLGTSGFDEIQITQTELNALESDIRVLGDVNPLGSIAIGLHWHRDHLYGEFSLTCLKYQSASAVNVTIGNEITMSLAGAGTFLALDKIVTTVQSGTTDEVGYILGLQTVAGGYEPSADNTETLSGAVTSLYPIYHQTGSLANTDSFAAHMWKAFRPNVLTGTNTLGGSGWNPLNFTYAVRAELDLSATPTEELFPAKRGYSLSETTIVEFAGEPAILEDYFIVSGDLYDGTGATVILQFSNVYQTLFPPQVGTGEAVTIYHSGGSVAAGTTIAPARAVFLPGIYEGNTTLRYHELTDDTTTPDTWTPRLLRGIAARSSKYVHKSANFFAKELGDAFFGTSGAGRSFMCSPVTSWPLVLSGLLTDNNLNDVVEHQYLVSGGVGPYNFVIELGSLPTGLSMDAEGLVTGTISALGEYAWRVRVYDSSGLSAYLDQGINVGLGISGGAIYEVTIASPVLLTSSSSYDGTPAALVTGAAYTSPFTTNTRGFSRTPDGLYIAATSATTTGTDGFYWAKWNGTTGTWDTLPNPADAIGGGAYDVEWSHDGNYLACTRFVYSPDNVIIYARSGDTLTRVAQTVQPSFYCYRIKWSPDDSMLAVGHGASNQGIALMDISSGVLSNLRYNADNVGGGMDPAFSPDGAYLAACTRDTGLYVYAVGASTPLTLLDSGTGPNTPIGWGGCHWNADGIITNADQGDTGYDVVQCWTFDGVDLTLLGAPVSQPGVRCGDSDITADGRYLACIGSDNDVYVYDLSTFSSPVLVDNEVTGAVAVAWGNV